MSHKSVRFYSYPTTGSSIAKMYLVATGGPAFIAGKVFGPYDCDTKEEAWGIPYYTNLIYEISGGAPRGDRSPIRAMKPVHHVTYSGEVVVTCSDQCPDGNAIQTHNQRYGSNYGADGEPINLPVYDTDENGKLIAFDRDGNAVSPIQPTAYIPYKGEAFDGLITRDQISSRQYTEHAYHAELTPESASFSDTYRNVHAGYANRYPNGILEETTKSWELSAVKWTWVNQYSMTIKMEGVYTLEKTMYGVKKPTQTSSYSMTVLAWIASPGQSNSQSLAIFGSSTVCNFVALKVARAHSACSKAVGQSLDRHSSLATEACSAISALDMNNIENLSQAKDVGGFLPPISSIAQALVKKDAKSIAKASADTYLWYKYSAKPTYSDLVEITEQKRSIIDNLRRSVGSRKYTAYHSRSKIEAVDSDFSIAGYVCCTVRARPRAGNALAAAWSALDAVGLSPGAANGWDLVPYSFVIDWFFGIGDALAQVDIAFENQYIYDIGGVCFGHLAETSFTPDIPKNMATCSKIDVSYYHRTVSATLPPMEVRLGAANPSKHILDGAALIIANW